MTKFATPPRQTRWELLAASDGRFWRSVALSLEAEVETFRERNGRYRRMLVERSGK